MEKEFTVTTEDIESVKNEIENHGWTFVRWDIAEFLIDTGDYYRCTDVNEDVPMNFIPLAKF